MPTTTTSQSAPAPAHTPDQPAYDCPECREYEQAKQDERAALKATNAELLGALAGMVATWGPGTASDFHARAESLDQARAALAAAKGVAS